VPTATRTFRAPLHRVGLPLLLVLLLAADSLEDVAPDWPALSVMVVVVAAWAWCRVRLSAEGFVTYGWRVRRYRWTDVRAVDASEVRWLEQGVRIRLAGRDEPLEPGVLAGIAHHDGADRRADEVARWWLASRRGPRLPDGAPSWGPGMEPTG
jgi:hypothetical protein